MGEIKDFNCTYDNSAGISGAVTEGHFQMRIFMRIRWQNCPKH